MSAEEHLRLALHMLEGSAAHLEAAMAELEGHEQTTKDCDLNRVLAEMQGLTVYGTSGNQVAVSETARTDVQVVGDEITWDDDIDEDVPYWWDPVNNWQQLAPIMEQHVSAIEHRVDEVNGDQFAVWAFTPDREDCAQAVHGDFKRAVALAVVGAREEYALSLPMAGQQGIL